MLEVRLLGAFEVKHKKKSISISSRPAQSLFAYLILSARTSHRREKLAGLLWPDSLEETARDNLRHALWRMRKALEAADSTRFLHADDVAIGFKESSDYWLDAAELEKLDDQATAEELIAVLSDYQGELLPGFYDEWVVLEREHLHSIFEHHMARLLSLFQKENRWLDILDWGERWIKLGQTPEPAYRALMSAHSAKGDISKVVATYERCVKALKEFGVEPSQETRVLYERLRTGIDTLEVASKIFTIKKSEESPKTNVPVPLTSFIGRARELEEVKLLLSSTRLLTLTGLGGIGKTRLAIQAAHELLRSFKDGVWWVELAPLTDEALVPQAVAQVLGVRESPDQSLTESVKSFLREKQALLILDNCEHLVITCTQLAEGLLSQCANLRIMATSREALGITGEATLQVPALSSPVLTNLPSMQAWNEFDSIQLFLERAEAAHPDLRLTQQNAFAVPQICHRLDGIPLAIELAAARVKLLSLEEIAIRLDDRFAFLTQGSRTALPRHKTLQAAIDWSYDLLSEDEQVLFRRMAVFAGGWTLKEAQEVCFEDGIEVGRIFDLVTHLVEKSLVIMRERVQGARFQMLETIREYALQKLTESNEATQVRNRHLDFFMRLTEEIEPKLRDAEQTYWLTQLEIEHDNLRAALEWSLTGGDFETGMRLAGALWLFWDIYGYQLEGHIWLDRILFKSYTSIPEPSVSARAKILYVAGHLRQRQGDFEKAREHYTTSLALYRQLGNELQVAVVLRGLGEIAQNESDLLGAKDYFEQSLQIFRSLDDIRETTVAVGHLAVSALLLDDYEQAATLSAEILAIARKRGNDRLVVISLTTLGFALCGKDKLEEATIHFKEALALQSTLMDKRMAQYSLIGLGLVAFVGGHPERAARLFAAAEALRAMIGVPLPPSQLPRYDALVTSLRADLGQTTFEAMWAEGQAMTMDQAMEFALQETG